MGGRGEGEDEVGCGSDVECVGERASGAMEHVGWGIDDDGVRELDREREVVGRDPERGRRDDGGHGRAEDEYRWRGSGEIQSVEAWEVVAWRCDGEPVLTAFALPFGEQDPIEFFLLSTSISPSLLFFSAHLLPSH